MAKVAQWQLAHPKHSPIDWTNGAFYSGLLQYGLSDPEGKGLDALREIGEKAQWGVGKRHYHADDHCVGHAWVELAALDGNPDAAAKIQSVLTKVKDHPSVAGLEFGSPKFSTRWFWCDALFMAPPTLTKLAGYTGDRSFLDFMDREFRNTADYLFDREAGLITRDSRYFKQKAANGKKLFWSRGNGWVLAGIPLVLRDMPRNWPNRPYYEDLFKRLARGLKGCQSEDGSWHASLLDPSDPPLKEMSGTLFITYGLIWGVNNGLLDPEEYLPVIKKAWKVANDCVDEDGLLGWVQPIADKPGRYSAKSNEVYGAGAYLLAGTELRKLVIAMEHPQKRSVSVTNPAPVFRPSETIEVDWSAEDKSGSLRVFDVRDGRVIPHQLVDVDQDGKVDKLLFQGDFYAGASRDYWIISETRSLAPAPSPTVCFSRHVPERMDDFAWENDVTAHRLYGPMVSEPAPKGEGLVSSGADIWCKYGPGLVVDEFYRKGNYHANHGKGLDMYKVGPSRGAGGTAVLDGPIPKVSANWASVKNWYNGPVRTAFEITYAPWKIGNGTVRERRLMTLDAGSPFTKVVSWFEFEGGADGKLAVGINTNPKVNGIASTIVDSQNGYVSIWGTPNGKKGKDGIIGSAIIVQNPSGDMLEHGSDTYLVSKEQKRLVWYMGAMWNQASHLDSAAEWAQVVARQAQAAKVPLRVKLH